MDSSPPGSSVHRYSLGENTRVGCYALLQWTFPIQGSNPGLPHCRWIFSIFLPSEPPEKPKNTGVGSLSLLQRNFPTQESNQDLLHCRQILDQLSYPGSHIHICIYIYIYIHTHTHTHVHLIQLSIDRYVGCFHILIIVKMLLLLSHFSRVQLCATP